MLEAGPWPWPAHGTSSAMAQFHLPHMTAILKPRLGEGLTRCREVSGMDPGASLKPPFSFCPKPLRVARKVLEDHRAPSPAPRVGGKVMEKQQH